MTDRKVAWLIERSFPHPRWYAENSINWHWWTAIAADAKQFASKAEAEAFPAYQMIAGDPEISVTEHVLMEDCPHDCCRPGDCDGSCTHPDPGLSNSTERELRALLEEIKSSARDLLATTTEERHEPSIWNPRVARLRAAIAEAERAP